MEKYIYELKMKVRDYECDLQGIVNNANYQHYLEHTRHEFLTSLGMNFGRLHEEGVDPVVARLTMSFKTPLRSGDEFISALIFIGSWFLLKSLSPLILSVLSCLIFALLTVITLVILLGVAAKRYDKLSA